MEPSRNFANDVYVEASRDDLSEAWAVSSRFFLHRTF